MTAEYIVTALIFIAVSVALLTLLSRLFRLGGRKDESAASNEHSASWDGDSGDGGGD